MPEQLHHVFHDEWVPEVAVYVSQAAAQVKVFLVVGPRRLGVSLSGCFLQRQHSQVLGPMIMPRPHSAEQTALHLITHLMAPAPVNLLQAGKSSKAGLLQAAS